MGENNENRKLQVLDKEKYNNNYSANLVQVLDSLKPLMSQMAVIQGNIVKSLQLFVKELMKTIVPLVDSMTLQIEKYSAYFKELADAYEKAYQNPDSLINWWNYSKKLSNYLWTVPFDIDSTKLKKVFAHINSEKEFDNYMQRYFTTNKINKLFDSIDSKLPRKHRNMFNQIKKAFFSKSYSLANVGIMAIIDELCSYFLIDKGCSGRQDLFKPIIEDLHIRKVNIFNILDVMILSENLNVIYENIEFNESIKISTHKKARRNPSQHGRSFSNRKIDTLMLLNTMFNLLIVQEELKFYKNKLYKNKKSFYIPSSADRKIIKDKIKENINSKKEPVEINM